MKKLVALSVLFALFALATVPTASAGGSPVFATLSFALVAPSDNHFGGGGALLVGGAARGGGGFSLDGGANTGTISLDGWMPGPIGGTVLVFVTIHTVKPKDVPDMPAVALLGILDTPTKVPFDFDMDGNPDTTLLFFVRLVN